MSSCSGVPISPSELLRVVNQCLINIENYNGEDDKKYPHKNMWLARLFLNKPKFEEYVMKPKWTYTGVGIITRLNELKRIANNVLLDNDTECKDIYLSETTYDNLYLLLNKSDKFQPYIFGNWY